MSLGSADAQFMAEALQLAELGRYTTAPNPVVGCVIVHDGVVVGRGFHEYAGGPHAEIVALAQAGDRARGATIYVTLEPCCHTGRTGPCTQVLLDKGVARVVVAMEDPNPRVSGSGIRQLREAGVDVEVGLMSDAALALNPGFVARMRRGRPFIRVKTAASLDGGTALETGASKWITGPDARQDVQWLRARSQAVVTGIGTVCSDDPQLTVRDENILNQIGPRFRPPVRVVIDTRLRLEPTARLFESPGEVIVFCGMASSARVRALNKAGATVITCPDIAQQVDLDAVLKNLAAREINEVLVEAGAKLTGSFLSAARVDELIVYQSACLLGHTSVRMAQLPGLKDLSERRLWYWADIRKVGDDLRLTARPRT